MIQAGSYFRKEPAFYRFPAVSAALPKNAGPKIT